MTAAVQSTLGIIAGGGDLPLKLIQSCQQSGRPCFVLGFEDAPDDQAFAGVPHALVRFGAIGDALNHLRAAGVQEIVMAGRMKRPSLSSLRPDMAAAKLLKKLGASFFSGDDTLLRALVSFLEEEGFRVIGAEDVIAGLLVPETVLTRAVPNEEHNRDIEIGMRVAKALGALDVGQAVIVQQGYVLGVEAVEGTDALIERCAALKREPQGGVLVKAKKPAQESRVDLPAIGLFTLLRLHDGGFSGIACEAGGTLLIGQDETVAKANELGLFIVGINP